MGSHNIKVKPSGIALQEVVIGPKEQGRTGDHDDGGLAAGGEGEEATNAAFADFMREVTMQRSGYRVPVGRRRRRFSREILQDMSAVVPPGRLVAVMGPTGCGKTSLVNALAGRLPAGGTLEGEVLVNGRPRGRGFRSLTGYVLQDDLLFANLTVRESFDFASRMRLPSSVPSRVKAALVTQIITELGLAKAQNTYIGSAYVRGVSGGERKRVNIGLELLANPSLLFLDEPTSGLDAFQAQNVMELLWALAHSGRSIFAAIHQPRSSIYRMFDLLLLLSEGQAVYFGPAEEAVSWFAAHHLPCPAHYNPADFFIDAVSLDYRTPKAEAASRRRLRALADSYRQQAEAGIQEVTVPEADKAAMQAVDDRPRFANSLPVEFGLLLRRAWKQQSRDRIPQVITLMQTIVLGFVLAAIFSQIELNQTGIQDETGVLFFCTMFAAMTSMFGALNSFPSEAGIINRERAGKAYHVLPYYLARFICDMPIRVGQGVLFGCIVYWIVGLNPTAAAFFIFIAIIILEGLCGQALGVAVSAAVKSEKLAFAVAPALTVILMLCGGFFVNKDSIPIPIRYLTYISHLYWAFMGLVINDFRLNFGGNYLWQPFLGLSMLVLGFNAIGYLVLRFTKPRLLPLTPAPPKKSL
ncbi:hypothetical protein N2152v2_000310 [Parachlorella kessleri]